MRNVLSILIIFFSAVYAYSQDYKLEGFVWGMDREPLTGASVVLLPQKQGTITDEKAHFTFSNVSCGKTIIEVSFMGYELYRDTFWVDKNTIKQIVLIPDALSLSAVVVKDNYAESRKQELPLNVEVINKQYLKENIGGSLMHSLEKLGGVESINIGSGQSKPLIRGLGFNRVVVVENDIKHEGQQWGADHGLEIDQYLVDNVEVIKGPASLSYGSDAIGGIVDIKNTNIPETNTFGGEVDLTAKSNNELLGTSISLYGRKNSFYMNLRGTFLDYADYKVPVDSIDVYSYRASLHKRRMRNTAGQEQNVFFKFGVIKPQFQTHFFVSAFNNKSGFFANVHGIEPRNVDTDLHDKSSRDIQFPYQSVRHLKINNTSSYRWNRLKLETNLGVQNNHRKEMSTYVSHGYMPPVFPDSLQLNPNLERGLEKYVFSSNVKARYSLNGNCVIKSGINADYHINQISGRSFIIPEYRLSNIGLYLLTNYHLTEKNKLQIGLRYDLGNIKTVLYSDWFPSPVVSDNEMLMSFLKRSKNIDRTFSNISYALGYNYNAEPYFVKLNIGKGFRMPIAKELSANGVNYHHFSYEVGDENLQPERSYQLDLGMEYKGDKLNVGISPFVNYFSNYIYLNPTPYHDKLYGNGNQIFKYTQCKVFRYGGEAYANYSIIKNLQLGAVFEYVYSEQLSGNKKGYTLPFSPPASGVLNAKYIKDKFGIFKQIYFSLDFRMVAAQNLIVPPEKATKAYQVFHFNSGGTIFLGEQAINFSFQIRNLLNAKYFNHISYYRLINVPEAGRNFVIHISIPFWGQLNRNQINY